jgi:hypothetical protein
MQARIVSGAAGARWLIDGWRFFRAAPLGWLAIVAAYLLITNVVAFVPVIGIFAALMIVPGLSAGLMAGARAASQGDSPRLSMLFEGFRRDARTQLALGAVYMAGSALVFMAMTFADDGGALRAVLGGAQNTEEVAPADLLSPLVVAAALYTPVMMAFWFAPPLAAWNSMGAAKALFFSFLACMMNWRAFLAYGAVTALVMLVLPFMALTLLLLVTGGAVKLSITGLMFAFLIVLLPTLLASFYASYRDVFAEPS